jgi:hypothetical protein
MHSKKFYQFMGIVLSAFRYCDKIPEINNLKGGKVYFGSQFQPSSSLWSLGSVALGLWWHSTSWWEHMTDRGGLFTSWHLGSKKRYRKGLGPNPLIRLHVLKVLLHPSLASLTTRPLRDIKDLNSSRNTAVLGGLAQERV